ncbi:hypothetical protein Plhal304r1_c006g0022731 [Plasmopara halstedii]
MHSLRALDPTSVSNAIPARIIVLSSKVSKLPCGFTSFFDLNVFFDNVRFDNISLLIR